MLKSILPLILLPFLFWNNNKINSKTPRNAPNPNLYTILLTSTAFMDHGTININFTCQGDNISPDLAWDSIPDSVKSFAITMQDFGATPYSKFHWIIYNIPPDYRALDENIVNLPNLTDGTLQGLNDLGNIGYTGPCPGNSGNRFEFIIYALNEMMPFQGGERKYDVLNEIDAHVMAVGRIVCYYRPIE